MSIWTQLAVAVPLLALLAIVIVAAVIALRRWWRYRGAMAVWRARANLEAALWAELGAKPTEKGSVTYFEPGNVASCSRIEHP